MNTITTKDGTQIYYKDWCSVKGWYCGTSIDSQGTLAFSARAGIGPMNETFPLERVSDAYQRMMSGKARFRVVLTMK